MKEYLSYEQFGAVGDGITDDFDAIIATHAEANRKKIAVKARDGAKYYIGGKDAYAVINTDVDFGNAEFIIDDRAVKNRKLPVFNVESDELPFTPDIKSLKKGQTKVDFPHEGTVFVQVKNANKPIFIRKGLNKNNGSPTQDIFTVDADGNVLTEINWDYDEITFAEAKRIDDAPITVEGGVFTTISNREEAKYDYFSRNIVITRPNVTIRGIKHYMKDVPEEAAPYAGFIDVKGTANIKIIDCLLTPRFIYWTESKVPGEKVAMGSYGMGFSASVNVLCRGVTQTVDIHDTRYWGLVCSNFCKHLTFEDCNISRFDAHQGVSNVTLKNCTFGHQCVRLIGFGTAYIENCHIYGSQFILLRSDYGSAFYGDLIIKNSVWHPTRTGRLYSISAHNTGDHDFGYVCRMPEITLDGFAIDDERAQDAEIYILPNYHTEYTGKDLPHPYQTPKTLKMRNVWRTSGERIGILENPAQYKDLTVIEE